jgi:arsenate reductase
VSEPVYNVLFICTGNSARSIMAEAILNREGRGRLRAFSAGSRPRGAVNPHALALLQSLGYDTAGLRSKSWDEFAGPAAPVMDFVFTVCDDAAGETCPVWPGHPATAHWGVPDPSRATGTLAEIQLAFDAAYRLLATRIGVFTALPLDKLDRVSLHRHLADIGALQRSAQPAA